MAVSKDYYVYMMTNTHNTVLYTGVTNNLIRRVHEHKNGFGSSFTKKYNVHKLVYFEMGDNIHAAIAREKQIKAGSRQKKVDLINSLNPEWIYSMKYRANMSLRAFSPAPPAGAGVRSSLLFCEEIASAVKLLRNDM